MEGNDGQQYESTPTKGGVYRWLKLSKEKKQALTLTLRVFEIKFPVGKNLNRARSSISDLLTVRHQLETTLNTLHGVQVTGGGTEMTKNGMMDITVDLKKTASDKRMKTAVQRFAKKHKLKNVKIQKL